jgi:hypothetical protein
VVLPALPDAWFALTYAVTADGQLARLSAPIDARGAWRRYVEQWQAGETPSERIADVPPNTPARLHVIDAHSCVEGPEFELKGPFFPWFDRLPDGNWIIAEGLCRRGETTNARLLAPDGTALRHFCLGNCIAHLQCDALGTIWVGYTDDGIGSNSDDRDALETDGVAAFDDYGNVKPQYALTRMVLPVISDCEAMNVGRSGVWLCVYDEFPVIHITSDASYRCWGNPRYKSGVDAIAVAGDYAVLFGGYLESARRATLARFGETEVDLVAEFAFEAMGEHAAWRPLATARDDIMHIVRDDTWYRLSVADVVNAAGAAFR